MVNVVIPRATFHHIEDVVTGTDVSGDPVGIVITQDDATAFHGALTLALGSLSPQPAELAGQAVAQMGREADHGALKRLRELVNEHLRALGVE